MIYFYIILWLLLGLYESYQAFTHPNKLLRFLNGLGAFIWFGFAFYSIIELL